MSEIVYEQCKFMFAPGVQCEKVEGHADPYYPYIDYGQTGWYSTILSQGSDHTLSAPAAELPPRKEWTGNERKDTVGRFSELWRFNN